MLVVRIDYWFLVAFSILVEGVHVSVCGDNIAIVLCNKGSSGLFFYITTSITCKWRKSWKWDILAISLLSDTLASPDIYVN